MTRLQLTGAAALLLLCGATLGTSVFVSRGAPFLLEESGALWIGPPAPVSTDTVLSREGEARIGVFRRDFQLRGDFQRAEGDAGDGTARLRARALGALTVKLNGRALPLPSEVRACLKQACEVELAAGLVRGNNALEARVANPIGFPLLWLRIEAPGVELGSDQQFTVESFAIEVGSGGVPSAPRALAPATPAAIVDDTRPYEGASPQPTPLEALRSKSAPLAVIFALAAALSLVASRAAPSALVQRLPEVALALVTLVWTRLYLASFVQIPIDVGYDAGFHLEYVNLIRQRGELPLATDAFSAYHPPLFYVASALLMTVFRPEAGGLVSVALLRAIPLLSGLGIVWLTWALARRLLPRDPASSACAVLFAGFLPLDVYMSAYLSNETLHAFLAGAALLAASRAMLRETVRWQDLALVGFLLGLALLTKFTAVLIAGLVVCGLAFHWIAVERLGLARSVGLALVLALGAILVGGFPYVRNWLIFGDPLVWNLDLPGDLTWWQPPSFRTGDYYASFGASLAKPYFALFHSFWDAEYASLFGEGFPPSVSVLADRHGQWRYDWMSAGFLLGLPAAALALLGFGIGCLRAIRGDDLRRRAVFTLVVVWVFTTAFTMVSVSIRYPFWGGMRASYGLAAAVPAAICAGLGLGAADRFLAARAGAPGRALFHAWLACWAATVALSFGA